MFASLSQLLKTGGFAGKIAPPRRVGLRGAGGGCPPVSQVQGERYCIWSRMTPRFSLTVSALLISATVAYGCDEYSAKEYAKFCLAHFAKSSILVRQSGGHPSQYSNSELARAFIKSATKS